MYVKIQNYKREREALKKARSKKRTIRWMDRNFSKQQTKEVLLGGKKLLHQAMKSQMKECLQF